MEEKIKVKNKARPQTRHLIPLKKGQTANPNGRPKGQRNYATIYREALIKLASIDNKTPEELEEEILASGIRNARKGSYSFYKDLLDRLHGTAVQKQESNVSLNLALKPEEIDRLNRLIDESKTSN